MIGNMEHIRNCNLTPRLEMAYFQLATPRAKCKCNLVFWVRAYRYLAYPLDTLNSRWNQGHAGRKRVMLVPIDPNLV